MKTAPTRAEMQTSATTPHTNPELFETIWMREWEPDETPEGQAALREAMELFGVALHDSDAEGVQFVAAFRDNRTGLTWTETRGHYRDGTPCTGFHVRTSPALCDELSEFVEFVPLP